MPVTGDPLRLSHIPPIYGRELSFKSDFEGNSRLSFVIYACDDLFITRDVEFELKFPPDFQTSGGKVVLKTRDISSYEMSKVNEFISPSGEINFPWLETARYPVAVWFYAARRAFRKPNRPPWKTPILVRNNFFGQRGVSRRIGGACGTSGDNSVRSERYYHRGAVTNASNIMMTCGAGRTQGRRNYMEDVDFFFDAIRITDKRAVAVYGVLDGHGGKECAQFAADDIPMKIAANLRSGKACPEALFRAFIETDREFLRSPSGNSSGSTANVMLWDPVSGFAYVANTADTRAVLSRAGNALDLSVDRKATDAEEISRIAEAGGYVANGRVQGSLAVSRALGDSILKVPGMRILIPDPEISTFRPNSDDEFVLIATDGLWDVMSSSQAVGMARELLVEAGLMAPEAIIGVAIEALQSELSRIAEKIASHAVTKLGSQDNVTVMIVKIIQPAGTARSSGSVGGIGASSSVGEEDLEDRADYWEEDEDEEDAAKISEWEDLIGIGISSVSSRSRGGATSGRDGCISGKSDGGSDLACDPSQLRRRSGSVQVGASADPPAYVPVQSMSEYGSYHNSKSSSMKSSNSLATNKVGKSDEDDMMDFLLDDSNF